MLPSGVFNTQPQEDMAIVRTKTQWFLLVAGLVFLFTLVLYVPIDWRGWLVLVGIYAVAALGLHIMTGLCGQFSMGQAAFMAVGAYATAVLGTRYGVSPWATLPLSGLAAGTAGLVFGIPALRIKGFYLVLATIAAQFIIIYLIREQSWTGQTYGLNVPKIALGGGDIDYDIKYWWLTMAVVVLMVFFAKNIQRTATGRKFVAVRDNDLAAEVMGVNLFRTKLLAFFIGCSFAGIAGWLWVHYLGRINPDLFTFQLSLWFLGMIIIGGLGSTTGAVMGAVVIMLTQKAVDYLALPLTNAFPTLGFQIPSALSLILFALVVIFFILIEPKGLYHRFERIKLYFRLNPFSY
jgi:branched-chain amino acid transport system permease protein